MPDTTTTPRVTIDGYDDAFPIDLLTPYRQNPREGDIGAIAESLQTHGQFRPLVVNRGSKASVKGEVLAGNHTLQAAVELGWDTIAVGWVDVDDDTAARIVLADNRTNDLATYDFPLLADLLAQLQATPLKLAGTGFTGDDLDDLLHLSRPPSLDEVSDRVGGHKDENLWPQISMRVPPKLFKQWTELDGDTDLEKLEGLLA